MKHIVADPVRCMACRACEFACALAHADTDDLIEAIVEQGAQPRIYIEFAEGLAVPLQCRHCQDAPCARVCPSGALVRVSRDEPVRVDQEKCIGCSFCVEACPFGVIALREKPAADGSSTRQAVIKCDLCVERQADGLQPACVSACPVNALTLEEIEEVSKRARSRAARALVVENDPG